MTRKNRVTPTPNGEGATSGKATPSELRLATQANDNRKAPRLQDHAEAERCEGLALLAAKAALGLNGGLAFQQASLARHYAGRALSLMTGARA